MKFENIWRWWQCFHLYFFLSERGHALLYLHYQDNQEQSIPTTKRLDKYTSTDLCRFSTCIATLYIHSPLEYKCFETTKFKIDCLLAIMSFNSVFHIIMFDISPDGTQYSTHYLNFYLSYTRYLRWFYELIYGVIWSSQNWVWFVVEEKLSAHKTTKSKQLMKSNCLERCSFFYLNS